MNSLSLYSSSIFLFQCLLIPSSIVSVFPFSFLLFVLLVLWTWGHTMIMMANWNSQQPVSNVCMHGSCQTCQFFWPLISSNKSNHFRNRTKEKYVCVNEWNIDVILLDLLPTKNKERRHQIIGKREWMCLTSSMFYEQEIDHRSNWLNCHIKTAEFH